MPQSNVRTKGFVRDFLLADEPTRKALLGQIERTDADFLNEVASSSPDVQTALMAELPGRFDLGGPTKIQKTTAAMRWHSRISQLTEALPPLLGWTGGAVAGAAALPPIPTIGAMAGAGVGAGAGRAYTETTKYLPSKLGNILRGGPIVGASLNALEIVIEREQKRDIIEKRAIEPYWKPAQPAGLREIAKRSATEAVMASITEVGTRGVLRMAKGTLAPIAGKVSPVAAEAKGLGIQLAPAEAAPKAGLLEWVQAKVEGSMTGRERMAAWFSKSAQQANEAAERTLAKVAPQGTTSYQAGEAFRAATEAADTRFTEMARQLYGEIDTATRGVGAPTTELKALVRPWIKELKPLEQMLVASDSKILPLLESVQNLPEHLSYQQLAMARSNLLTQLRQADKAGIGDRLVHFESELTKGFDQAMMKGAAQAGPDAPLLVREANALYRRGSAAVRNDTIRMLARRNPEDVARTVFTKESVAEATAVQNALTGEFATAQTRLTWNILRRKGLQNLIEKAELEIPGEGIRAIRGSTLATQWDSLGPEVQEMLGGAQKGEIEKFIRVARAANLDKAAALTKARLQFYETGLLYGAGTGALASVLGERQYAPGVTLTALALLAAPGVVARLMTSRIGLQWLTEGLRIAPGTEAALKLATRLGGVLGHQAIIKEEKPGAGAKPGSALPPIPSR